MKEKKISREELVAQRINELGAARPNLVHALQLAFMNGDWRGVIVQATELQALEAAVQESARTLSVLATGKLPEAPKKGGRK